jgi:PAT family beta-lactamase induction signal transducer AmpG
MVTLGFASGLPNTIATETASAYLAKVGFDTATIGWIGAISSIYAYKFLWAPFVDARPLPGLTNLGRRRSWLLALQCALALGIASLAIVLPASHEERVGGFASILILVAFLSATLDIVVSAWTVNAFPGRALGVGGSLSVIGYRAAMLAAGAIGLQLAGLAGWRWAFVGLGLVMAVTALAPVLSPEPSANRAEPVSYARSLIEPVLELWKRLGLALLLVVAITFLFRLPDQLTRSMQQPFLLSHLQFELTQFGWVRQGAGIPATLAGAILGGAAIVRFGMFRTLVVAGVLQALSNLGFAWLGLAIAPLDGSHQPWLSTPILSMLAVGTFENLCGGAVATVFVAWLMSLCDQRHAATQYAILSGGMAFTGGLASGLSGYLAASMTWPAFFAVTALAGIPGIALALAARMAKALRSTPISSQS